MPYRSVHDLPPPLRRRLPPAAQDIYVEVFNNAWREYASPAKRRPGTTVEETAHRVAWAAVKKRFVKTGGVWLPR